jgi:pimeloyl-ACP methyl ester carboxylesterase
MTKPLATTVLAVAVSTAPLGYAVVEAAAQVQSPGQQACATGIEKSYGKMVKIVGKGVTGCMKDIAKSKTTAAACFGSDVKGKVAKTAAGVESAYAGACVGNRPDFGFGGAAAALSSAYATDDALLHALFGADLGAALPIGAPDALLSKCQQAVTKSVLKCHDTRVKEFSACNKAALSGGATSASATVACIGADAKGKIAKACDLDAGGKVDKIRGSIAKSCGGVDLVSAFPQCAASDPAALHGCLAASGACVACSSLAELSASAEAADCDGLDNAAADDSCIAVSWSNATVPSTAEPAETPGSPGVVVTNPKLVTQFGPSGLDLNSSLVTRWRIAGPERQPDAILILAAGFGGGSNNFKLMAEDLIPRVLADHGLVLELWAVTRRSEQLEDREGSLLAIEAADEMAALDWYYGGALGIAVTPLIASGPNRRAEFYNTQSDIPFLANWTSHVFSRDIDAIVEQARTVATNANVFLGGHSAGTGFTARYAATDFEPTGLGPVEAGYAKLRGLVLFEGGGATSAGAPLTADSLDRMEAKFDGGLFGAVRDNAPRCVDGVTPCTIANEAVDCVGQIPPKCTEPTAAYSAVANLGPELTASSEPSAIQAFTDPDGGLSILQTNLAGPGTAPVDLVPALGLLNFLPPSTAEALFGQFLDDDGLGASLSPAVAAGLGDLGGGSPRRWLDITEGPFSPTAIPYNGPAPTSLPAGVWGQEKELVSMSRFRTTFTAADSNAADWYYASSGLSVTSVAGRCAAGTCTVGSVGNSCANNADCGQSISLDSTALSVGRGRRDIVNLTQAANVDIPVICFGGSNGLTPVGASYLPFAQSLGTCTAPSCNGTPRVVDASLPNPAFPTFGEVDGGYEVHIREGLSHFDVVAAEDGPDSDIYGPLGAFLARNVQ